MPETPDDGLPGQQPQPLAPGQDPPDLASAAPRRRLAWGRRRVLIPGVAAVAAAVAAALVLWPGSRARGYAALPPPCTLVTAATLAKYVPGATGKPLSPSAAACEWHGSSGSLGQRDLLVSAAVFGSSSGVARARQLFGLDAHATVISAPRHEITYTVTRRPLTGLGDQAMVQIYQPGKNVVPPLPVVVVDVRSQNAEFSVTFNIDLPGAQPPPTSAELVSETIAIARDVLAVLASPGTA
jgi:hypothetical protein